MKAVLKYQLPRFAPGVRFPVMLPADARFLAVQRRSVENSEVLNLWVLGTPDASRHVFENFFWLTTGHEVEDEFLEGMNYLGTVQLERGGVRIGYHLWGEVSR